MRMARLRTAAWLVEIVLQVCLPDLRRIDAGVSKLGDIAMRAEWVSLDWLQWQGGLGTHEKNGHVNDFDITKIISL